MEFVMKVYDSVIDLIGNTPLIKLNSIGKNLKATLVVKLESANPLSSVKDRLALALIEDGEKSG